MHVQDERYVGKNYTLQEEAESFQLIFKNSHNKTKKVALDTIRSIGSVNILMNEGYWYGNFHKAYEPFKVIYPSRYTGNYKAWKYWSSFPNQTLDYKHFRAFANDKLAVIRDSVYQAEIKYIQPVFNLLDSATLLTTPQLAIRFDSLRANRNGRYFEAAATNLCQQNPETFLRLVEHSPVLKKDLFRSVYHHKKAITALKAVADNRATKKDFARRRTGYAVKEGALITAVSIAALIPYALITWGIVALVSK